MRHESNVRRNLYFSTAYHVFLIISPLLVVPYIARVFEASGIGAYTLVNTVASYFLQLAMVGVVTHGSRLIAYVRNDEAKLRIAFSEIYLAQLFYCLVAIVSYFIYLQCYSIGQQALAYIQFLYIFSGVFDVAWFFSGIERIDITAKCNFVIRIICLGSIFAFVKSESDLWLYTLIMGASFLGSTLSAFVLSFRYVRFVQIEWKNVYKHLLPMLFLFFPVIASSVYKTMDKVMLGVLTQSEALVGYYSYSEQLLGVPQGIITSIGMVMLPRAANMMANGKKEQAKEELRDSMFMTNYLAIAFSFGIAAVAKEFVPFFLGNAMAKCSDYVVLLSPSNIFITWGYIIRNQFLIPAKKDNVYIISIIIGAILNFVLNLIFISKIGIYGVILGTLISELFVAVYQSTVVKNELEIGKYVKDAIPLIIPASLMYIIIRFVGNHFGISIVTLFLETVAGGIVYIGLSGVYLFFADRELFKKIVGYIWPALINRIQDNKENNIL